ncbi:MAG: hypothetical protein V4543_12575 [Bacteroidota bacterium]
MQLLEVGNDEARIRSFLELPVCIYRSYSNWIRPLNKDIEETFNPKTNKNFRNGEAIRWILIDDSAKPVGRVAAFIDKKKAKAGTGKLPVGGMGFFECIDNYEAALILFNACKTWLAERGAEAMDGPINFGDRDRRWGLLLEGDYPPSYGMDYHPPYYKTFFERFGFRIYFRQLTYYRPTARPLSPSVHEKAERIFAQKAYTFEKIKLSNSDKYANDFRTVYNAAWAGHGVPSIAEVQAKLLFKKMKPVIDEDVILFAYHDGKPIAFFIILPELNQIFRHFNGRFGIIEKLRFLYYKYTGHVTAMFGLVFGVIPEFQGKGVEAAITVYMAKTVQQTGFRYHDFEMNWVGDFNPRMMHAAENFDGDIRKIHGTYRYMFNPDAEWVPCPLLK